MRISHLEDLVRQHAGEFVCEQIHHEGKTKTVDFTHIVSAPAPENSVPDVGRLPDFYDTFGAAIFYYDKQSGEAARYIAPCAEWNELKSGFNRWIEILGDDDRDELLPRWVLTCIAVGKIPRSGNYVLVATEGEAAGQVFEFDHDGLELRKAASDMIAYVEDILSMDSAKLAGIASHMRFVEGDQGAQWWIREFRDNRGCVIRTGS